MTSTTTQTLSLDAALQQAVAHHMAGRLQEAEHLYRAILQAVPGHSDASHNLGILAGQVGQHAVGLPYLKAALEANPEQELFALSYTDALLATLQATEALNVIQAAIERGLNTPATQAMLQKAQGALKVSAKNAMPTPAEINQIIALFNGGQRHAELESRARQLLERCPNSGFAWNVLGVSLQVQGKDGLHAFQRAAALLPDDAEVHNNLGNALKDRGQLDSAVLHYRRTLEIKPDFAETHYNLGNALRDLGQPDAAVASYRQALKINPGSVEAHNNLGNILKDGGQLDEAMASYRRALEIKPDFSDAHCNLGNAFQDLGQLDEAQASYGKALQLQPDALQHAIHAHLLLPVIPDSTDDLAAWRERYRQGLASLADMPGRLEDPANNVNINSFFLAYQNDCNRTVMEGQSQFFRGRLADLSVVSPHVPGWLPPITAGRRIRVGFLSGFLVNHTIGKLFQGLLKHLHRSRFEVVLMHTAKARRDSFSQQLDQLADKVVTLPARLSSAQQVVMAEQLDVLFYTDIGMTPSTYFLAYSRLAPVQAVSWGHPDTTGLDTVDYFVSASSIEPVNADEHYTERLICLNRMPCFYDPPSPSAQLPDRAVLGLPETGTLYGCPQSLFKLHPDFDKVLAAIAEDDPAGHIVLLEGKHATWSARLKARWAKTVPVLLERVIFLPRMSTDNFMALIAHMDVLLDPIHFGSGNTLYEAMTYGIPVVTWPGQFMRGRIVAGAYKQMGVAAEAPIAERLQDYAPLALALGRDPERRQALRQVLAAAAKRELFSDMKSVREFEMFLSAAVDVAAHGKKLAADWTPDSIRMP